MPSSARPAASKRSKADATTRDVKRAASPGTKTSKKSKSWTTVSYAQRAKALVLAVEPLLEFFSVADAVFTEDDALSPERRQVSLGRLYEAWQACRRAFDPDFVAADHRRPRKWSPPRGDRVHKRDRT